MLNLASCYLKLEEHNKCVQECSEVLRHSPGDRKALYRRGQSYSALKQYPAAVADLQEALQRYSAHTEMHLDRPCTVRSFVGKIARFSCVACMSKNVHQHEEAPIACRSPAEEKPIIKEKLDRAKEGLQASSDPDVAAQDDSKYPARFSSSCLFFSLSWDCRLAYWLLSHFHLSVLQARCPWPLECQVQL